MKINNIKLSKIINSTILVEYNYNIKNISTNSKEIIEDTLFIPIIGNKFNGNDYIIDAIENGSKTVLVSNNYNNLDKVVKKCIERNVCLMSVEDTLKSYHKIAKYYLEQKDILVISITGSNGKTSFKKMLNDVLIQKFNVISSIGNMNNHIGVPQTILNIENEDILILEMGMNHQDEIKKLTNIANPNIRVITNIAESHIGNLGSLENILEAKLEIATNMKPDDILLVNSTNKYLNNLTNKNIKKIDKVEVINNKLNYKNKEYAVSILPNHNYIYIAMIIEIATYLGIAYEELKNSFKNISLPKSRFEILKLNNSIIVNDAYNSNYESLKAGIEEVIKLYEGKYKINIIVGDILELGEYSQFYHNKIGKYLNSLNCINNIYLVGNEVKYIMEVLEKEYEYIQYDVLPRKLLDDIKLSNKNVYYFKSSNSIGLEKIVVDLVNEIEVN